MYDAVVFIDNGTTGSIGVVKEKSSEFFLTPVVKCQDYTKKKKTITRIDGEELVNVLSKAMGNSQNVLFVLERPMINPARFNASIVAARAFEATLVIIEQFKCPYYPVDSKEWQGAMLPKGKKEAVELST
jgi:hypothetical protein